MATTDDELEEIFIMSWKDALGIFQKEHDPTVYPSGVPKSTDWFVEIVKELDSILEAYDEEMQAQIDQEVAEDEDKENAAKKRFHIKK